MPRPNATSKAAVEQRQAKIARDLGVDESQVDFSGMPEFRDNPHPQMVEGKLNPLWASWELGEYLRFDKAWWNWTRGIGVPESWPELNSRIDGLKKTMGMYGVTLEDVKPAQSSMLDPARGPRLLQRTEEELDAVESAMNAADESAMKHAQQALKKKWLQCIHRVRTLQHRARNPVPSTKGQQYRNDAQAAAHLLRFATYIERDTTNGKVYEWEPFHVRIAWEDYQADLDPDCRGLILMVPPGHGKTSLLMAKLLLLIARFPDRFMAVGHNADDEAKSRLSAVRQYVDGDSAGAARYHALFPHVALSGRKGDPDSEKAFTVDRDVVSKDPTLVARSVTSTAVEGKTLHFVGLDDPVSPKEEHEVTTRVKTCKAIEETWYERLRGVGKMWVIGYPWANDDAFGYLIGMVKKGALQLKLVRLVCCGPEMDFKPLWKDRPGCNRAALKAKYRRNPRDYRRRFQMQAIADEDRIVKKLHFYAPDDQEVARMFKIGYGGVCLDPTSSGRGDKAGVVTGHLNPIKGKLVVTTARELGQNQIELGNTVIDMIAKGGVGHKIDKVLLEARTGFAASGQYIAHMIGTDEHIVYYNAYGQDKEKRLKAAAPYLERGAVLFPGVRRRDVDPGCDPAFGDDIIPDPKLQWFYDEILDFGAVANDHAVDALTVWIVEAADDLDMGESELVAAARALKKQQIETRKPNPHMVEVLRPLFNNENEGNDLSPQDEEVQWMSSESC